MLYKTFPVSRFHKKLSRKKKIKVVLTDYRKPKHWGCSLCGTNEDKNAFFICNLDLKTQQ